MTDSLTRQTADQEDEPSNGGTGSLKAFAWKIAYILWITGIMKRKKSGRQ